MITPCSVEMGSCIHGLHNIVLVNEKSLVNDKNGSGPIRLNCIVTI